MSLAPADDEICQRIRRYYDYYDSRDMQHLSELYGVNPTVNWCGRRMCGFPQIWDFYNGLYPCRHVVISVEYKAFKRGECNEWFGGLQFNTLYIQVYGVILYYLPDSLTVPMVYNECFIVSETGPENWAISDVWFDFGATLIQRDFFEE